MLTYRMMSETASGRGGVALAIVPALAGDDVSLWSELQAVDELPADQTLLKQFQITERMLSPQGWGKDGIVCITRG